MPKKPQRPQLKGMDAFMQPPPEIEQPVGQDTGLPVKQQDGIMLMKGTYYITPEHDLKLERIRLARKQRGIKVDKSALIREAIDLLSE